METALLSELELKVDYLMRALQQTSSENKLLRQRLAAAVHDRSELQEKNHQAVKQIKSIITQLREELA